MLRDGDPVHYCVASSGLPDFFEVVALIFI